MKSRTKPPPKKTVSGRGRGRTEEVPTWQEDPTEPERDSEATAELDLDDEVTAPEARPRYGSGRPDAKKTAIAVLEPRPDPKVNAPPQRRRRAELSAAGTPATGLAVLTPLAPGMREPGASARNEIVEVDTGDIVEEPSVSAVRQRTRVPLGGQLPSAKQKRPRRK